MSNIKITSVGPNPYVEDEKVPADFIYEVAKTDRKNIYNIKILHPNKTRLTTKFKNELIKHKLYDLDLIKVIQKNKSIKGMVEIPAELRRRFKSESQLLKEKPSQDVMYEKNHRLESFDEALSMAKELASTKLKNIETVYEDIKHIPAPKKGKMELKLKKTKKG